MGGGSKCNHCPLKYFNTMKGQDFTMKWFYIIVSLLMLILIITGCVIKIFGNHGFEGTGGSFDNTDHKAPKTIVSKEITSFEYSFSTSYLNEWHDRNIPYDSCTFKLTQEDDNVRCTGSAGGYTGFFALFDFEFLTSPSALDDLQTIIEKHDLAQVNGVNKYTRGIPENFASRLNVNYASGESIFAANNAGPILTAKASLDLYDFFLNLTKEVNGDLMYSDEEFRALYYMLNGRFETIDGKRALLFENFDVDVYENDNLLINVPYYLKEGKLYSRLTGDGSFAGYSFLKWRDDVLFAVGEDGTETEFVPVKAVME